MLLIVLVGGSGSLLLTNLFISYHKILNDRHKNRKHPTHIQTSKHNM